MLSWLRKRFLPGRAGFGELFLPANFKMQVRQITAGSGSHRPDFLASSNDVPGLDKPILQMTVERIDLPVSETAQEAVGDDDALAPPCSRVAGKNHHAVGNGINGISMI